MKKLSWSLVALCGCFGVLGFSLAAYAQQALDGGTAASIPDPTADLGAFGQVMLQALSSSNWKLLAVLLVVGLVYAVRTWGGKYVPFLQTDRGGALTALVMGVAYAIGNAIAAGGKFSLSLVISGAVLGVTAAGGFSVIKRIIAPPDKVATTTVAPVPAISPAAK